MRGNGCTQPYVRVETLEVEVERKWGVVQLEAEYVARLQELLEEEIKLLDRYAGIESVSRGNSVGWRSWMPSAGA